MSELHALTIDVEDYFQVSAFEEDIPRSTWSSYSSRVEANTRRVLDLLSKTHTQGTFFVLGWIAEHYPHLVREIASAGHEIASHGYWHRLIYRQTAEEFRSDVRQAKVLLEQLIGREISAYRAPSFSITEKSRWAIDVLAEEGYRIDSSIFPVRHDRYGIPGAPTHFHPLDTPSGVVWECPPSVLSLAGLNLPVAGGGYFRLGPLAWTRLCIRRMERSGCPFLLYLHPWELDPEQPRLSAGTKLTRFRHHVNISTTERKLGRILREFSFGSLSQVLEHVRGQVSARKD